MQKTFLLIVVFFLAQICTAQRFSYNQGGTTQTNYFSVIPYENIEGKIIVTAEINGKKHRFLLDTGAPNVISKSLFDELKPIVLSNQLISDQSGKKDSMVIASVNEIVFGNIIFNNIPTVVANQFFFKCFNIDGFIGSNMLRNSIVRFSSIDKTITLTDDKSKITLNKKQSSDLMFPDLQSTPFFKIKLKNKKLAEEALYFDSGDNDLYNISFKHFNLFQEYSIYNILAEGKGSSSIGINGISNDTVQYRAAIPEININGAILQNAVGQTTSYPESRIGSKLLDYGIVTLDFKNKKFYFEPFNETINLQEKQWGISPILRNGKAVVGIVWDEKLKDIVHVGDKIISIDGISYENKNPCDVVTNVPLKNKNKVALILKDNAGVIKNITLEKE